MLNLNIPFVKLAKNKFKFNFFLFLKLPAAYFSGLKVINMSDQEAQIAVRYQWFTQNPSAVFILPV